MSYEHTIQFLTSSIITLVICVLGLLGNALCGVVLFNKQVGRSSYIYILRGLTISDTCLLTLSTLRTLDNLGVIALPTYTYFTTIVFFWDWISTSATKYFTVTVAIERFFVITFPLKAHMTLTPTRAIYIAWAVFGFCVLLSCFSYIYVNFIDPDSYHFYVATVLHFLPFLLVVIFNTIIWIELHKIHNNPIRKSSTASNEDYNITKMLFTVVLVFGICYSFEFYRRVMNFMWKDYMNKYAYYDYTINNLADIFYVLNSSVNFVIYCALGKRFRAIFFEVFNIRDKSSQQSTSSVITGISKKSSINSNSSVNVSCYGDSESGWGSTMTDLDKI